MKITDFYNHLQSSLQTKILVFLQSLVIIGGLVALTLGILLYGRTILKQAEERGAIDLNSAWMVYNEAVKDVETIVRLTAEGSFLREGLTSASKLKHVKRELERIRIENHLDFLTLTDPQGIVVLRTRYPYDKDDDQSNDEMIRIALKKKVTSGTQIIPQEILAKEGNDMVRQAFMVFVPTPKAKPREQDRETSGMVLKAAVPVIDSNGNLLGTLYGGRMINRNYEIVDRIKDTVFRGEKYKGKDVGNATIFQWDVRISTNVKNLDETRAIGTRVSSDIYEKVLENGLAFIGRAFVVNANYITAYEPIKNINGETIGILYVGTLEQPFLDLRNNVIFSFIGIALLGVLVTLVLGFFLTRSITRPIDQLVNATHEISQGRFPLEIPVTTRDEIGRLANSFSQMTKELRRIMDEKDAINQEMKDLNTRYLELLGFTTHELRQPLGVINGYLVMLEDESIGKLTTPQQKEAVSEMRTNITLMTDMIQKYLQLSKIESGQLSVNRKKFRVYPEAIQPVVEGEAQQMAVKHMVLTIQDQRALEELEVYADPILIRIVFSNLINNAIKYGRKGGTITIGYQRVGGFHRFHVKNEGTGIDKDSLGKLFNKFYRVQRGESGRVMGTGLGLYNTKNIIEKHGGKIWAESQEGNWVDFVFLLPENP
jgi:two-component system NtrC family sensor kinase